MTMWKIRFSPDPLLPESRHQAMKSLMLKSAVAESISCRHEGDPCRFCGFRSLKQGTVRKSDMGKLAENVDRSVGRIKTVQTVLRREIARPEGK
jgi:hypothetical protein